MQRDVSIAIVFVNNNNLVWYSRLSSYIAVQQKKILST